MIQELLDLLPATEKNAFQQWLSEHPYLLRVSDKELLLLMLFRLDALRKTMDETHYNTKTHWS